MEDASHAPQLSAISLAKGEKKKERRKGEEKKIKSLFIIMKEAVRISQWKTHQPEIPA